MDSADDLLGPLIEPYTIVPLGDGRTLAVLSLTDPTHLTVTYPGVASRLLPFISLGTLAVLPMMGPRPAIELGTPANAVVALLTSHAPISWLND